MEPTGLDCPWSAWTRAVVEAAGHEVEGDTGSAIRAAAGGIGYFIHTTETGVPPAVEGYRPLFDVDGLTVYSDGVRAAWVAHGFTVWMVRCPGTAFGTWSGPV